MSSENLNHKNHLKLDEFKTLKFLSFIILHLMSMMNSEDWSILCMRWWYWAQDLGELNHMETLLGMHLWGPLGRMQIIEKDLPNAYLCEKRNSSISSWIEFLLLDEVGGCRILHDRLRIPQNKKERYRECARDWIDHGVSKGRPKVLPIPIISHTTIARVIHVNVI